jgi:site-specific recombinase XerD
MTAEGITIKGQLTREGEHRAFPSSDPRRRTLALPNNLATALASQSPCPGLGRNPDLLFTNHEGNCLTQRALQLAFRRAIRKAGLDPTVTLQTLRDSYTVSLIKAGEELESVSCKLGHRSVAATQRRYASLL